MSTLLHSESCPTVSSQLDLFNVPPSQTSLDDSYFIEYKPVSSLSANSAVEFSIPPDDEKYLDLENSYLHVRVAITDENGDDLADGKEIAPVNNFLHSLFGQVNLYINGTLTNSLNDTYPYKAYIETLLSFGKAAKQTQLVSSLWIQDTASQFDTADDTNQGYRDRRNAAAGSKQLDLIGRLHLDLAAQNRYILNKVDVRLKLVPSKNEFCLHTAAAMGSPKIVLKDASFYCRKVRPNDAIRLAHEKALQQTTAKYPIRRIEVKTFTIPQRYKIF